MKPDRIKAVLFDFGGVLAEEGFFHGLRAMAEQQGLDPDTLPAQGMDAVFDSGYVTGQGTEAEFWALLRERTGLRGHDAALRQEILSRFIVRPWMLEWVGRLRERGYITGILSDQTDWLDYLDAQYGFKGLFDHLFVSFSLGKGKRDPSLFDDVAQALRLAPEEILFVDDAPGNVERAHGRGLQTLRYRDRATFEAAIERLLDSA